LPGFWTNFKESRIEMFRTSTLQQVVNEIDGHIRQCGGAYATWYCGIAADPRDRLFSGHSVDEKNVPWIHRDCGSDDAARKVEAHFHAKGCQGDGGGGDGDTRYVYAYKITASTRE
jgi:hypothetical protein